MDYYDIRWEETEGRVMDLAYRQQYRHTADGHMESWAEVMDEQGTWRKVSVASIRPDPFNFHIDPNGNIVPNAPNTGNVSGSGGINFIPISSGSPSPQQWYNFTPTPAGSITNASAAAAPPFPSPSTSAAPMPNSNARVGIFLIMDVVPDYIAKTFGFDTTNTYTAQAYRIVREGEQIPDNLELALIVYNASAYQDQAAYNPRGQLEAMGIKVVGLPVIG